MMRLKHPHVICPSYIDDICLVVEGKSPEKNATELKEAVATCFMWGKENSVAFDDPKSSSKSVTTTVKEKTTPNFSPSFFLIG